MTTTDPTADAPSSPPVDPNEVRITVNGREVVSTKGEMVIVAAQRAGEYIPRFCHHERLAPVGMCRMCLVDIDTGRGPMLQPSCMVPVAPGMRVETESTSAKRAQEGIIELLLANHPLDCPVCDKGGECPLQDQAFSHGPGESRYLEEKRHYEKPIPISDLVFLDRERCILCDRCTRFADEVAGDALIHFTSRGNNTYITTFPDEPFSSYFSGNTVQICPVGALTASPYRFKARPWDLEQVESTCTTCAVGCRTTVQSSRDSLVRYLGVDSDPVNHGWLCDRGRFNFEAVTSPGRLTGPLLRTDGELRPATWSAALTEAARAITEARAAGGPSSIGVIGGARGTNEDARAWARLARDLIGTANVDAQLGDGLPASALGLPRASIDETCEAATVILLAPDLKEELPILHLRVRAAAEQRRTRIIEIGSRRSGLTRHAWRVAQCEPGGQEAAVRGLLTDDAVAAQLSSGPVVVVVGRANLAESADTTVSALAAVIGAVPTAKVLPVLRRGNVNGAIAMGLTPSDGGLDTRGMLEAAAAGSLGCLVLLGADPLSDFPDGALVRAALDRVPRLIAVDTMLTKSSERAHVVLAAAGYAEKSGTHTNIEGRVTRLAQKVTPAGTSRPDWMIAAGLADALGADLAVESVADITAEIAAAVPGFGAVTPASLDGSPDGVVADLAVGGAISASSVVVPPRVAGTFRLVLGRTLYDLATGTAASRSLSGLAATTAVHLHPSDAASLSDAAEVRLTNGRGSTVLPVVTSDAVLPGTAWVPFNHAGGEITGVVDSAAPVTDVEIRAV